MALLIGMSGEIKDAKFEIVKDRVVLGRNQNCDIVVNDGAVSSQHCYIARRGGRYVLHDLNSTNGTQLDGQRITEQELASGQTIQLGATELTFDASAPDAAPPGPAANTQLLADVPPQAGTPKSFSSVSPFGARRRDSRGLWLTLFIVFGLLALAGLVWFLRSMGE